MLFDAVLAQSAEHFLGKEEVGGSNPLNSFTNLLNTPSEWLSDGVFFM